VRPGVRRIVRVPKPNARDHLLDHLKKIVIGSLPDLTGRQGCRRVGIALNLKKQRDRFTRNASSGSVQLSPYL
jgi:hypothetical protein